MTWNELCEKAKELGYKKVKKEPYTGTTIALVNGEGFAFYEDGTCEYDCEYDSPFCGCPFAYYRTPDQMYKIMEALK